MTKALKDGNMDEATDHKHRLEERQRVEEKQRAADNKPWNAKYFSKEVEEEQRAQGPGCLWNKRVFLN